MDDEVFDRWNRKYYATRIEVESCRKKGEIVYYEKPCVGGYYLVKPKKRIASKKLLKQLFG